MSDNNNRPDEVIAKEFWDGFHARNASIIVDLMYGQLKSTVTCMSCERIVYNFDPYLSVCLPIVKEEKMEFNFVQPVSHSAVQDKNDDDEVDYELNPLQVLDLAVTKPMRVRNVKEHLIKEMKLDGVTGRDLVVANQKYGKITDYCHDDVKCFDIDQDREYTMVYYVPGQTEETEVIELNFHKVQKRGKNSYTVDQIEKALPRLYAMTRETTIMDVKRLILEKMRGVFEKVPEDDETLNEIVQVHI